VLKNLNRKIKPSSARKASPNFLGRQLLTYPRPTAQNKQVTTTQPNHTGSLSCSALSMRSIGRMENLTTQIFRHKIWSQTDSLEIELVCKIATMREQEILICGQNPHETPVLPQKIRVSLRVARNKLFLYGTE
jgi:hypothetical protein